MSLRSLQVAVLASVLAAAAACGASSAPSAPVITLSTPEGASAVVDVTGLSGNVLRNLERPRSPDEWTQVLRVSVEPSSPPMLGTHAVADGVLRFTPQFPLDPGRQYHVRFDGGQLQGWDGGGRAVAESTVGIPAVATRPSTVVSQVYPSGEKVPANLLRMYVEFSNPMGRKSGVEYLSLLDHAGREIPGAVLPLDYEFWSPDHTRFTVFFDPGRVKKGILPNQQMGRPLEAGDTVTLVVRAEWRDANGLPLQEGFRRTYRVGPADEKPLAPSTWTLQAPRAGTREPMVVTFPAPLDRGLLQRALSVGHGGQDLPGSVAIEQGETQWSFTPTAQWRAGSYDLRALDILEDPAGNQIGRAFEVDNFDSVDKSPNPQTISIPFTIK